MKILRQLGVLVLLAATFVSPAMACLTPSAHMTAEERACCRMMHNQCVPMGMSASHSCCQNAARTIYAVPATKADSLHAVAIPISRLAASELLNPLSPWTGWVEHHDDSPPQSPPSTISILRI